MHKVALWIQQVLVPVLGPAGILVVAFFDSSFVSIPEINDILVVSSSAAHPGRAWLYALSATVGSLLGCAVLWTLGRRGGEALLVKRFGKERMERTRDAFRRWDVLALALPAVLPPPMPFKVFVVSAGVFGLAGRRLAITLLIARGLRYSVWAALGACYGDEALDMLKAVDGWFAARLGVLLAVVGAVAMGLVLVWAWRRRRGLDAPGPG
jgi:membrane protein YqaA with SNARE-associated domain